MATLPTSGEFVRNGYWSLYAQDDMGGVESKVLVNPPDILLASTQELVLDGMIVTYVRVGGGVMIRPQAYPNATGIHTLDTYTTTETVESHAYWGLGIPIGVVQGEPFLGMSVTTANMDTVIISAWGRYPSQIASPVLLDGIKSLRSVK